MQRRTVRIGQTLTMTLAAVLLSTSLATSTASAQNKPQKVNKQAARKHFETGERFYQKGQFKLALAEYMKAMNYMQHPAFIFNMAQCHRQLGQYRRALFFFKLFLSKKPNAANRAKVQKLIAQMEAKALQMERVAQQKGKLSVVTVPAGAEIYVDRFKGKPLGVSPAVITLTAGKHLLVLKKAAHRDTVKMISLKPKELKLVEVKLQPGTNPPADSPMGETPGKTPATGPARTPATGPARTPGSGPPPLPPVVSGPGTTPTFTPEAPGAGRPRAVAVQPAAPASPRRVVAVSRSGTVSRLLTFEQVQKGFALIKHQLSNCYARHRVPGVARTHVTVAGASGNVTAVVIKGRFAKTPTGRCVKAAISQLRFNGFREATMSFVYPVLLRH